eukprot:scaffold136001_cov31-Tisochrysis_lutea.AAC.7
MPALEGMAQVPWPELCGASPRGKPLTVALGGAKANPCVEQAVAMGADLAARPRAAVGVSTRFSCQNCAACRTCTMPRANNLSGYARW